MENNAAGPVLWQSELFSVPKMRIGVAQVKLPNLQITQAISQAI